MSKALVTLDIRNFISRVESEIRRGQMYQPARFPELAMFYDMGRTMSALDVNRFVGGLKGGMEERIESPRRPKEMYGPQRIGWLLSDGVFKVRIYNYSVQEFLNEVRDLVRGRRIFGA